MLYLTKVLGAIIVTRITTPAIFDTRYALIGVNSNRFDLGRSEMLGSR